MNAPTPIRQLLSESDRLEAIANTLSSVEGFANEKAKVQAEIERVDLEIAECDD